MTEEREIVGFVLPFAAGIAVCTTFSQRFTDILSGPLSLTLTGLCMTASRYWRGERKIQIVICISMAFFLGIFCMGTSSSLLPESFGNRNPARLWIKDRLPFRDAKTSAIISAFITGDRSGLDMATKEAFRASGASHLLALSGLHLGIIYLVIQKFLSILGKSPSARHIRYAAIILCTGIYTYATGASPSLCRAFLFILLRETSILLCRPQASGQILMSALTIQLILSPYSLFSTGFQLSYLAVLGITYIYPKLGSCWQEDPDDPGGWMRWLWNSSCLTISCQITTAPLVWLEFGTLPGNFLLANIMAIPLAGIIIPSGIICIILNGLGQVPDFLLEMTERMTSTLLDILSIISRM